MDTKRVAAEKAVEHIEDGMIVGLGTGSTAYWAIKKIGERIKEGLHVEAVASSAKSESLAKELGIPIRSFAGMQRIDVSIDGADEVDPVHHLIKGGGGALLREKILAYNSTKFLVVVDESKLVRTLGAFPLPVEIVPFAASLTIHQVKSLGCEAAIRQVAGETFISDNGNLIIDCRFNEITNPQALNEQLHAIPGVVETGLFLQSMVHSVFVGYTNGTVEVL